MVTLEEEYWLKAIQAAPAAERTEVVDKSDYGQQGENFSAAQ